MTVKTRPWTTALEAVRQRKTGLLAATMLTSVLAACSSVPDAANPVEWYKGTRDAITGNGSKDQASDKDAAGAKTAARQEEAGDFPSLSSVPERPAVTPENQRELEAKGLAADAQRSKYSDEQIRRDSGAASARPAGVMTAPATTQPAPQAAVSQAPMAPMAPASAAQAAPSRPMSAQEVFQQRVAEQNSAKITPEMMQGFFTQQQAPVVVGGQPQQAAAPAGKAPRSMTLGSAAALIVPFNLGSANLSNADMAQLRELAEKVVAQGRSIKVIGHSSSRANDVTPDGGDVSAARADAVARAMISLGVQPRQVSVAAMSDTQPVSSIEAANRRVEIFVE